MNLQKDLSGQISGKVLNQTGTPLSGLPHGNPVPGQMQNPNIMHGNIANIEPERRYMQQKILEFLMQKRQQTHEAPTSRIIDLVKRLEVGLYKNSGTKEEYLNLATLGSRLQVVIKRLSSMNNQNQQFQHVNSSPAIGTMIPTPGYQPPGNSSLSGTLPFDSSLATNHGSNTVASGSFLPAGSGYQQSSSFSANAGGSNMIGSVGVERMTSQMIPTPGFNNSNDVKNNSNYNQLFMNMESSNNGGAFPALKSTAVSQPMWQMQQVDGQNSRILHNMGDNRSTLQHNSSGLPNVPFNGGLGKMGNMSQMNRPGTTEGYLSGTMYKNSPKSLNQQFEHRPVVQGIATQPQGDGYGNKTTDGSMPKINSTTMAYQSTVDSTQLVTTIEPQLIDQSDKMSTQSQFSVRENLVQPHHQSQAKNLEALQNQQIENQLLLNDGTFSQSVSEAKSRPGTEYHVEGFQSQVSEPCQFSLMQSQFEHNSNDDHLRYTQTSDQMQQMLHLHGQTYSNSQDVSRRNPLDQNVQDGLHHRLSGQDAAQLNNLSSEESVVGQIRYTSSSMHNVVLRRCRNINREKQFKNQQKWLLFLRHARRCPYLAGKCLEPHCLYVQNLLKHIEHCQETQCSHPRCHWTKALIHHHKTCQAANCPVCVPVKNFVRKQQLKALACSDCNSGLPDLVNGSCKSYGTSEIAGGSTPKTSPLVAETAEDLQPSIKRMKIVQGSGALVSAINKPLPLDAHHVEQHHESHFLKNTEIAKFKMEVPESAGQSAKFFKTEKDNLDNLDVSENPSGFGVIKKEEMEQAKQESTLPPSESASKAGKPKVKGVSMTELFTPEQVRQHIAGLRQWVGQSKAKAERNQAMEHSMSENSCQLCAVERLTFEPLPLYCTPCGARIKRNAMYYTIGALETRHYFCIPCYNDARGDTMIVDGIAISKARMEKKKNDEDTEESWVQCDKCEVWQHQICALFNARRNDCGQADYTCPNCYISEVERGERVPLPLNAVLGAKDLPKTILSDRLEQRLFAKLKQERQERARIQGKSYDEVPGAESLVVRVVSSVDKKLEVKPRFLEIFQEENFPNEFPYKSKVVLLFQKIEGVEVCLFGMYLQEFGSECQQPNHRRVYLSYLDSVKYFRPDVKAVTGEALRTFVYHEILIGYLEYCKQRGFASCYIWACPPLKGEDYILYCHPEIQKTPKSDKLREWYLSMLRKAMKESIVVELTNLYDHFFVSNGECKAKVTASRLPYFDGDYWPGAAEDMIFQLQQEDDGKRPYNKKGAMRKTITKRALKASGHIDLSGKASKDLMLMHKLGETISPMKEDFIMVHLHHACTHCCILMVSGKSWVCKQCRNFRLCDKCFEAERIRDDRERHPINQKDKHPLYPVEVTGVPDDTKDKDEILESEHFDTRQAFLSLCQGNHYQYDTLRRAKHSSMMVLYHLHNPSAPAFVATCIKCHLDLETGQGWRCEVCPEFDVCNACYHKDGGIDHPHRLYSSSDRDAQNTEARALRVSQLKKMLEVLVHASRCHFPQCQYPNCRKVKGLFRHGIHCKMRVSGGCPLCKKMWNLLKLHARTCKESQSECTVPRCRDLKEHTRRVQFQAESRRRAAVNEMMRQRAAEVSGDS